MKYMVGKWQKKIKDNYQVSDLNKGWKDRGASFSAQTPQEAWKLQEYKWEDFLAVIWTPQNLFSPGSRHWHSVEQIVVLPLTYFWRFAEISLFNPQKSLDKCHAWQMSHDHLTNEVPGNTKPCKSRIQIPWLASQHAEFL